MKFQFEGAAHHVKSCGCGNRWASISEDGTATTIKCEYKPDEDSVVGFSTVLDKNSGLPIVNSCPASSLSTVADYFKKRPKAKNFQSVMVTPLCVHGIPFNLGIWALNEDATFEDVENR